MLQTQGERKLEESCEDKMGGQSEVGKKRDGRSASAKISKGVVR